VFCELRLEGFSEEHRFSSSLLGYDASMREKPAGDFYSVDKAAKLLGRTPERVRQMLRAGQLEGEQEGDDPCALWKVHRSSVEAHRDRSRGHGHEDGF